MEVFADFLHPYILIGADGILIDGIKKVCKWNDDTIEALTHNTLVTVKGKKLKMEYKTQDSLLVSGRVASVEFGKVKK